MTHCQFSGFSFTFVLLVNLNKIMDRFHDVDIKIVKRQKSKSECCNFTEKNFHKKVHTPKVCIKKV